MIGPFKKSHQTEILCLSTGPCGFNNGDIGSIVGQRLMFSLRPVCNTNYANKISQWREKNI